MSNTQAHVRLFKPVRIAFLQDFNQFLVRQEKILRLREVEHLVIEGFRLLAGEAFIRIPEAARLQSVEQFGGANQQFFPVDWFYDAADVFLAVKLDHFGEIIGDIITNKPYLCKWETDAAIATDFRIFPEFRANKS